MSVAFVVLVTGCSSGLGRALAYELFTAKNQFTGEPLYRVFASARSLKSIAALKEDGIETVQLDVTKEDSIATAVAHVIDTAGRIDVLINNAAVTRFGPLLEQPLSEVREVLDADVIGLLAMSQAVGKEMVKQRSGVILNIGSISAYLTRPFAGTYCAAKSACRSVSEALRMELAPFDVDVVLVTVGAFLSSLVTNSNPGQLDIRHSTDNSVYHRIADKINMSATASQDPKTAQTAQEVAGDLVTFLGRRYQPTSTGDRQETRLPANFKAGGSVRKLVLFGFVQQWLWPALFTDRLLPKMFGLIDLMKWLKQGEPSDTDRSR